MYCPKSKYVHPNLQNVMLWGFSFGMFVPYKDKLNYLPKLNSSQVDKLIPSVPKNQRLDSTLEIFDIMNSATQ